MSEFLLTWESELLDRMNYPVNPCPFCGGATNQTFAQLTKSADGIDRDDQSTQCYLCGWNWEIRIGDNISGTVAVLRRYDINATDVPMAALGAHLRRNYSDIYSLAPERFERLIGDVFRDHEQEAVFTKKTRDGGVDIFLKSRKTGQVTAIVECKRYRRDRSVGIAVVQRLAGATLQWNTKKAYLVTTSSISSDGRRAAEMINENGTIELDFYEADDVLRLLNVYNLQLPSLSDLSAEMRERIIAGNVAKP